MPRAGANRGPVRERIDRVISHLRSLLLVLSLAAPWPAQGAISDIAVTAPGAHSASRIWYPAESYPELSLPDGRRETVRSMLDVAGPLRFGDFVWDEDSIPKGRVWVRVDLPRQILSV